MFTDRSPRNAGINRFTAVISAVIVACASVLFTAPASSAANMGDVEKSIVLIGTTWTGYVEYPVEGGGTTFAKVEAMSFCTGWFASTEGHIVTAGHCVDPEEGKEMLIRNFLTEQNAMNLLSDALLNWTVDGGQGKPVARDVAVVQPAGVKDAVIENAMKVTVSDFDPFQNGDVALLQAQGLSDDTVPLPIADERPEIGSDLTSIGFPGSVRQVTDNVRASFKTGTVSSYQNINGVSGIEINAEIGSGMSGGPTVNSNGEVVGVNSSSAIGNNEANFNFITDTANLQSFLKSNNVPINVVSAKSSAAPSRSGEPSAAPVVQRADSGLAPLWWILIAVGVLALLAVAFFVLRRKNTAPAFGGGVGPTHLASGHTPVPEAHEPMTALCPDDHENVSGAKFCVDCGKPIGRPLVTEA